VELRGAVCLVTGASSGIGRATALRLARGGSRVVLLGRDQPALDEVAAKTTGTVVVADLADPSEVERAAAESLAVAGRVDVLINNAGEGWAGKFADINPLRAELLVRTNLLAPIRLTRALIPGMLERKSGYIVNVASIAGHVGVRGEVVYAATKAGLIGFSESLRYELAGTGVGVTVVSPGVVRTAFFERAGRPYTRRFPRLLDPDRVARAIVRAIQRNKAQVFEPKWMAFPAWLRGTFPSLYRTLAARAQPREAWRPEGKMLVETELDRLLTLSYEELKRFREPEHRIVTGQSGTEYVLEIGAHRDDPRHNTNLRVMVSILPRGKWGRTESSDFIIAPDGSFP
jgi:short-subunit dehydrogenase